MTSDSTDTKQAAQGQSDVGPQGALIIESGLSQRELQVVGMMANGLTATEIAKALDRSIKTISTHRSRALEKTGYPHMLALAIAAKSQGLGVTQ